MKKVACLWLFSTILVVLLFINASRAQNYQNICPPGTTYFKSGTNIFKAFRRDSIQLPGNSDTIFYSYRAIHEENTWPSCFDTTNGSLFGFKIYKKSNGTFYFFNKQHDTITIMAQAGLNQSWKFCKLSGTDKLEAKVTSIVTETVLGTTDQVKIITLQAKNSSGVNISHFMNQKTILLSQHHGIFKTYDLYYTPDIEANDTSSYYLAGSTYLQTGYQNLSWRDIYNFEIGDEFHWDGYWSGGPTWKIMKTVLDKTVKANGDSVTYVMQFCKAFWAPQPPPNVYYTFDTIIESYYFPGMVQDISISGLPAEFLPDSDGWSEAAPYFNRKINFTGKYTQEFNGYSYAFDPTSSCWNYPFEGGAHLLNYSEGLGITYTFHMEIDINVMQWWENMVYYKKGLETWGTPVAPSCNILVGNKELTGPLSQKLIIYPNPAKTEVELLVQSALESSSFQFGIINQLGIIVKVGEFQGNRYLLKRDGLNSGIYTIQVFDKEKRVIETAKLLLN